jgi:hypothetical protein
VTSATEHYKEARDNAQTFALGTSKDCDCRHYRPLAVYLLLRRGGCSDTGRNGAASGLAPIRRAGEHLLESNLTTPAGIRVEWFLRCPMHAGVRSDPQNGWLQAAQSRPSIRNCECRDGGTRRPTFSLGCPLPGACRAGWVERSLSPKPRNCQTPLSTGEVSHDLCCAARLPHL